MAPQRAPRHGHSPAQPPAPHITGMTPVRPLGTGGFSRVYLYEQDFPRRVTAVKVLTSEFRDPAARADFTAEADAMGRLSIHPSIVSLWAAGVTTTGAPYLALEFCPGSMRERTRNRPAPLHEVLDAGVRLAGALESAHLAGLLHRDIKPSNVLITATGRPALSDFGIALLGNGTHQTHGTGATAHALTVPWSAPEVVTRHTTGTIASEIWALGATLYTFAAGHSPFEVADTQRNTPEQLIRRITQGTYTPITPITPITPSAPAQPGPHNRDEAGYAALNALLARAMAVQPSHRFSRMREFGAALQRLQQQHGYPVTPMDIIEAGWAGEVSYPPTSAPGGAEAPNGEPATHRPVSAPIHASTGRADSRAAQRAAAAATTPEAPKHAGSSHINRVFGIIAGATGAVGLILIAWWATQNLGWL